MKKRVMSFILVVILMLSVSVPVMAAGSDQIAAANGLYTLGLFKGSGTNTDGTPIYELDRAPTRQEAITMLVRLLGKESEALEGEYTVPFTDVDAWAGPYVGYAYENGLTLGTGDTTFGGSGTVTASEYLTFVLRALGYDSNTDFTWDKAWVKSDAIGLTGGEYADGFCVFAGRCGQHIVRLTFLQGKG